ncbi:MAG TPA: ATP-binding cassette domain-containing protein [Dehalococcoidia bacterium]|jgi:iron complex transport system ATP-binding protein|nr:cobalamin/Fe3+-siderophores ABC transporter ATP-binding protein [Chloroflexota bacterium]MDP5877534.1 ATP-binding cassette domain-containing protein [Dehalococcoidia bacterium]MDP6273301.1 ATP-binding cassette domain-containing protein [Dehalococcoidia bacterium]MDP7159786.1 ATP-binding cassette domain-containing protein [Dehalococcoidia bacterium]MDP7212755.1 ATP-binding cassette domain-containing protein [Dehalococcoidia bacterium]|tara:strand:+ start:2904 stop:4190 length:1287 start_codon:yes stop_codon:yes gene_type:complete
MTDTVEQTDWRLEARDVVYEVDAARLLDRVDLNVAEGELVGLVGPNGAGKTTLLRTIGGLLKTRDGAVLLDGDEVRRMDSGERAKSIAHVAQLAPLAQGFTALEVVMMGRYPHMGRLQSERAVDREVVKRALETTGVGSLADRTLETLSGGERQGVFVARALAQEPRLLLLDEPTSNLDINHQARFFNIVRGLVDGGMTAVAAIHDLSLAARFCDRMVLLSEGVVVADGAPGDVLSPENIEAAFGVRAIVSSDPASGSLNLSIMVPGSPEISPGAGTRIHVVCGGGTGARLMYRLCEAGFTVTAGPLGTGDTDRVAAESLGVEHVPVQAFDAIDDASHEAHIKLVQRCDVAVLSDVAFGTGNLRSLEALARAQQIVLATLRPISERDFTGGDAAALFERLSPVAAWSDLEALVTGLPGLAQSSRVAQP